MENEGKRIAFCHHCNKQFFPLRTSGKFCSDKCKQAAYRNRLEKYESCKLYTIGYQERSLQDFIWILKANGVKNLLDVRYSTESRFKTEFSEDVLQYVLSTVGIVYKSEKSLGVPFDVQNPYKEGDMSILDFEQKYKEMISKIDMNELAKMIKESGKTVLMCLERKAIGQEIKVKGKGKFKIDCHRSILANILKETGEFDEIIHL